MDSFDAQELEKLTKLARIKVDEQEKKVLFQKLSSILDYIKALSEHDLKDVPPCHHILEGMKGALRDDEIGNTLPRDEFLANSPSSISGMVRVPTVINKEM